MTALHPDHLAPFKRFERVEIPAMLHLGKGRVEDIQWQDDSWSGGTWMVHLKMADGSVAKLPAVKLRRA